METGNGICPLARDLRSVTRATSQVLTLLSTLVLVAAPVTFAQDTEKVAPRTPGETGIVTPDDDDRPRAIRPGEGEDADTAENGTPRPRAVRPGEEGAPVAGEETPRPRPVRPGETPTEDIDGVLLPALNGLVFVPSQDQIRQDGISGVRGVQARTGDILASPEFESVASRYLDRPVSLRSLKELNRDVVAFYAASDFPVVDVIIPEQDITGGVVQMVVLKGRIGEIRAEGNNHFADSLLTSQVRAGTGEEIRGEDLLAEVEWLNRNPFRHVDLVYTQGSRPGETDVVLRTQDRFPARFYGGWEDSGNQFTGDSRLLAGFNWGNAWGLDHQVNYQFSANEDTDLFRAHSGTYIVPLPWHHVFSVFGSHVKTQVEPGTLPGGSADLDLRGRAWQVSGRYTVPLPRFDNYTHEISGGFDFKSTNNNLEFGGTLVRESVAEINQFVLTYTGSLPDQWGRTTFAANVHYSPGDMIGANDDEAFEEFRDFASADYVYTHLQARRVHRLPYDFSLVGTGTLQFSNKNLLGSEQLGGGGYATVRGYEERAVNADEGAIVNLELRSPPISVLPRLGLDQFQDQLQLLLFWDYAYLSNEDLAMDEPSSHNLSSVGPGARYSIPPYLSMRFDFGWQLTDPEVGTELDRRRASRVHFGVLLSY